LTLPVRRERAAVFRPAPTSRWPRGWSATPDAPTCGQAEMQARVAVVSLHPSYRRIRVDRVGDRRV